VPVAGDLREQAVLVLLGTLLDLLALRGDVVGQLLGIPVVVRLGHVAVPVVLHQILEILAIRGSWVRDVVV
jgi:hypothetical protein